MNPEHLLEHAIRPALDYMGMGGKAAEQLVLGTAIVESGLIYLHQHNNGPARGFWQMEPGTYKDIFKNYLIYREDRSRFISELAAHEPSFDQLTWNLRFGAAMCRIHYRRVKEALPGVGDYEAMALYHKKYYNTFLGKTKVPKSIRKFKIAVGF